MTDHSDLIERLEKAMGSDTLKAVLLGMKNAEMTCIEAANALREQQEEIERLRKALKELLRRDEIETCQHEETQRGGFIWEICTSCGAKWADDKGGKPEWQDPIEWVNARAALGKDGA